MATTNPPDDVLLARLAKSTKYNGSRHIWTGYTEGKFDKPQMYRTIDGKCALIGIRVQRYIWSLTHTPRHIQGDKHYQIRVQTATNCINPSHLEIVPKSLGGRLEKKNECWKRHVVKMNVYCGQGLRIKDTVKLLCTVRLCLPIEHPT